ncbi:hypothetical protein SZN_37973, partial [Streptomyces zinciresistens K42]
MPTEGTTIRVPVRTTPAAARPEPAGRTVGQPQDRVPVRTTPAPPRAAPLPPRAAP